jgi:hypothetical protein
MNYQRILNAELMNMFNTDKHYRKCTGNKALVNLRVILSAP